MQALIEKIQTLTHLQLQDLMRAIADRFRKDFPEWDVVYVAMHKDPDLRKQEIEESIRYFQKDLEELEKGKNTGGIR